MDNAEDKTSKGYMGDKEEMAGIKTDMFAGCIQTDALLNEIPGNEKVKTNMAPKCPGTPPLDNNGIQALTGAFEMFGRIMATQARIDGMRIHNTICEINEHDRVYSQIDFTNAVDDIYQCTQELRLMKECSITR